MPSSIKLIIFDLDGTLMNAYRAVWESMNFSLKKAGFPPQSHETIKRSVGWGDRHLIEGFVGKKNAEKVLRIYRRHHTQALKTGTKFLPSALKTLKIFKKCGYRLAIASNRPTKYSLIALRTLKIRNYFDMVICADKVRRGKPHPDMFRAILKRFSLKPKEALYVGDMTIDAAAGKKAKIKTIIVLTGSSLRREVAVYKPYAIIRSLAPLPSVVEKF